MVTGNGGSGLAADLRRVTESGVTEMPKELMTVVVDASHDDDKRLEIMAHVRECLQEDASTKWRRVYAGLVLAEDLLHRGSPALLAETAEGLHFDVVQQLSLLEHYSKVEDRRVQSMVRTKAGALRREVIAKLQSVPDDDPGSCAKAVASFGTSGTGGSGRSAVEPPWLETAAPSRQMILNGVVTVGHCDDTSSGSSGDDELTAAPVAFREVKKPKSRKSRGRRRQRARSESYDSEDDRRTVPAPGRTGSRNGSGGGSAPRQAPAQPADLLDL